MAEFNPDEPRDPLTGEWIGGGVSASRSELSEWSDDVDNLMNLAGKPTGLRPDSARIEGDKALQEIARIQGFTGLPQHGDMDAAEKAGGLRLFRGLHGENAQKYSDAFRSGDYHAGFGTYGNGTYTSRSEDIARTYMEVGMGSNPTGVLDEMVLAPDAKITSWQHLLEMIAPEGLPPYTDVPWYDMGRYAAAKGYDAFTAPDGEVIILNRTKLVFSR